MIAITKGMVVLSAFMSAGIVSSYDYVASRFEEPAAATQVAHRFPAATETFAIVTAKAVPAPAATSIRKDDRLPAVPPSCSQQDWPYISQSCLVSADGRPMRNVSRVITVERRVGTNTSELTRVGITELAAR